MLVDAYSWATVFPPHREKSRGFARAHLGLRTALPNSMDTEYQRFQALCQEETIDFDLSEEKKPDFALSFLESTRRVAYDRKTTEDDIES